MVAPNQHRSRFPLQYPRHCNLAMPGSRRNQAVAVAPAAPAAPFHPRLRDFRCNRCPGPETQGAQCHLPFSNIKATVDPPVFGATNAWNRYF